MSLCDTVINGADREACADNTLQALLQIMATSILMQLSHKRFQQPYVNWPLHSMYWLVIEHARIFSDTQWHAIVQPSMRQVVMRLCILARCKRGN